MARVFVALYNFGRKKDDFNAMPPFYESFVNGLKDNGNEVLCFHQKTFTRKFDGPIPTVHADIIKKFDPELCILFCNKFWDISNLVDCPIIIYDVDSPLEYAGKNKLLANVGRYKFVVNQTAGIGLVKDLFNVKDGNITYIPFFSELHFNPEARIKTNINFLGTNFLWRGYNFIKPYISGNPTWEDRNNAKLLIDEFTNNPFADIPSLKAQLNMAANATTFDFGDLHRAAIEISGLRRLKYLSAVSDLGLEIRGAYWDIDCMNYFPDVAMCFNRQQTFTKQENEDFYNSTKISLNTKNIQAQNGFSFRVCDILASNACLVTEKSEDIDRLFPGVGIPMFTSPQEERDLCKKLLNNENMRLDIVTKAHEIIDKNHRFVNVIQGLEASSGITLHSGTIGSLKIYSDEDSSLSSPLDNMPIQGATPIKAKTAIASSATKPKAISKTDNQPVPAKIYYVGKLPAFKLFIRSGIRKEIYLWKFPLISMTQEDNKIKIKWLLLEKFVKKLVKHKNVNKKVRTKSGNRVTASANNDVYQDEIFKELGYKPSFNMPSNTMLDTLLKLKEKNRVAIQQKIANKEKVTVCIFVSRITCWFLDNFYKQLDDSDVFKPYIVVKPFMTMGNDAMHDYMNTTYEILKERGYRVIKTYSEETDSFIDIRQELNPDIVIYTKYWQPQFRLEYYFTQFLDKLTFYIPYAYDVGFHNIYIFDLINNVDRFLYNTPIHKEIASKYMPNGGKNVYVVGAPKIDKLFDKSYITHNIWKPQDKTKKRIIWAPHHEDRTKEDMYQFDAFYYLFDFMLKIAKEFSDEVQFAFKPHPMLKPKLDYRWGKKVADEYYQTWADLDNGQLETGEFIDLFLESDAMILDSVSFIAEYTATNKPALFTETPTSRNKFNKFGDMVYEVLYHTNGLTMQNDIYNFIKQVVIGGKDTQKEKRSQFVQQYLLPPNGKTASENIYDNIVDEIYNGDKIKK